MVSRNQSLDVLRGIAVLMVIACHYPLLPFMSAGGFGVDLFFVLSGFLISGLLFDDLRANGSIGLRRFFIRRGFKIYPPFFVLLGISFAFGLAHGTAAQWMAEIFFLQSYSSHIWAHSWSLAVEEHFYIVLPLLLIVLAKARRLHWIPRISMILIAFCFLARIATTAFNPRIVMYATHDRLDELFAGVALGYLYNFERDRFLSLSRRRWVLPLGVLLLIAPLILVPQRTLAQINPTLALNTIGFSLLVLWAAPRSYVKSRILETIGKHSYSIYLWHYPVCLMWKASPMTLLGFLGYVASALAIGIALAFAVEFPAMALREKLFPSAHRKTSALRDVTSQVPQRSVVLA